MKQKDEIILSLLKKYNKNKEIKVIDIGAGEQFLKNKVPKNMKYTSLDIDPKNKEKKVDGLQYIFGGPAK